MARPPVHPAAMAQIAQRLQRRGSNVPATAAVAEAGESALETAGAQAATGEEEFPALAKRRGHIGELKERQAAAQSRVEELLSPSGAAAEGEEKIPRRKRFVHALQNIFGDGIARRRMAHDEEREAEHERLKTKALISAAKTQYDMATQVLRFAAGEELSPEEQAEQSEMEAQSGGADDEVLRRGTISFLMRGGHIPPETDITGLPTEELLRMGSDAAFRAL